MGLHVHLGCSWPTRVVGPWTRAQAAGSTSVLELHGTIHEVECLQCRNRVGRSDFQHTLAKLNEAWLAQFGLDAATMVSKPVPGGAWRLVPGGTARSLIPMKFALDE